MTAGRAKDTAVSRVALFTFSRSLWAQAGSFHFIKGLRPHARQYPQPRYSFEENLNDYNYMGNTKENHTRVYSSTTMFDSIIFSFPDAVDRDCINMMIRDALLVDHENIQKISVSFPGRFASRGGRDRGLNI